MPSHQAPSPRTPTSGTTSGTTSPERTIGQLVADATHDVSTIVRSEIALAKAEVTQEAKAAGKGAGLFAGAAFVGLLALVFLFHTVAKVLDIWLPEWAAYLITTGLLLLIGAVLALAGRSAMKSVKGKPERTIRNAQDTITALKSD